MRHSRRWILYLLLLAILAGIISLPWVIKTERAQDFMRQTIKYFLVEKADLGSSFQELKINWYPLGMEITQLAVWDLNGSFRVNADNAAITPNWLLALTGEIAIEDLKLNRPNLQLNIISLKNQSIKNDSVTDQEVNESDFSTLVLAHLNRKLKKLGLTKLELIDGHLVIREGNKRQLVIPAINLVWAEDVPQTYVGRLRAAPINAYYDDTSLNLEELDLALTVHGFPIPEEITVQNLIVIGEHNEKIRFNGKADFDNMRHLRYHGNATIDLSLNILKYYFKDLPAFDGHLVVEAEIDSEQKQRGKAKLKLTNLAVLQRPFGNIGGEVYWDGGQKLTVKDLRITNMVGELLLNADIALTDKFPITLHADIGSFSLAPLLEIVPVNFIPIILEASGKANFHGTLWPFKITGEADLVDDVLAVYGDKFRLPAARLGFYTPPLKVKGGLTITQDDIEFLNIPVRHAKGGILWTSGGLSWKNFNFYMRIRGEKVNLNHIAHIVDLPWSGEGTLAVVIEGPLDDPEVSGTLEMQEAGVMGVKADQAKISIRYKDLVVYLPSIIAELGNGSCSGYFNTDMHPDDHFIMDTAIKLDNLPLERLLPQLAANKYFEPPSWLQITSPLSGEFAIKGPFNKLTGDIDLTSAAPTINGIKLSQFQVLSKLMEDQLTLSLWLEKQVAAAKGTLYLSVDYTPLKELLKFEINTDRFDLALLPELNNTLSGLVDINGNLNIEKSRGSGAINFEVQNARAYNIDLGTISIPITLENSIFHIKAATNALALNIESQIDIKNPGTPWSGEITFDQLPFTKMVGLNDYDGLISGAASLHGRLGDRHKISNGSIKISTLHVGRDPIALQLTEPVTLRLRNTLLELPAATFSGPGVQTKLAGSLNFSGMQLQLTIDGSGSAEIFSAIFSDYLQQTEGLITFNALLSGTISDKIITGNALLKNGLLRLKNPDGNFKLDEPVKNIEARLSMGPNGLTINKFTGKYGNGTLELSGGYYKDQNNHYTPALNLAIRQVGLNPVSGLNTTANGQLKLREAANSHYLLSGNIDFVDLTYTKDITLDSILPSFTQKPTLISEVETSDEWLEFDIGLTASQKLHINNNLIKGSFSAELKLTGTNTRTGLLGYVNPLEAVFKYRNNTFTISQASLDFTQQYNIHPRLLLQASTVACSDNVILSIEWEPGRETAITATGKTSEGREVPSEEVLLCLQFGFKSAAYDELSANVADDTSAYLPGSLDLLTSMTGLDEKAKELIPLPIDSFRLTSGYSKRTARTAPWVSFDFRVTPQLRMGLASSLDEVSDQKLEMEYSLTERSKLGLSWQSASDVPIGDFGLDLQLRLEFK